MCGISALFTPNPLALSNSIEDMTGLIRHRGPDDEGYALVNSDSNVFFLGGNETIDICYTSNIIQRPKGHINNFSENKINVALGHRRLSIIDLSSAGHQPMQSPDGRYVMVFNGEVYNYIELKKKLEAIGHQFHSHSDTEVVLAAYSKWGKEALHRFNGMFAFVIYDTWNKKLFAARDRFGIKPLYYWVSPQGILAFASEIKQFTCLPGWQATINPQRIYDFLQWGLADHTDETLFIDIHQVSGGQFIEIYLEDIQSELPVQQWYSLQTADVNLSFDDASEHFNNLFRDAIRIRLRADVPVGTGLSGGLDSSSIVCVVNEELQRSNLQNTFSACAKDPRFDEREFIQEVVKVTGVNAHYTFPSIEQLFKSLQQLAWHQDEPFSSTSIYAEWEVFKLVATTPVKVTLDGHGADEMLIGYHSFFGAYWAGLLRDGRWGQLFRELQTAKKLHGYGTLYCIHKIIDTLLPDCYRQTVRHILGKNSANLEWMNCSQFNIIEKDPVASLGGRDINIRTQSQANIIKTSIPIQLHWADRDSMAHSIESRIPFLDYRIVEFILGCPDSYKICNGVTKRILRNGMQRILPKKISERVDKMGFVTPEEIWVRKHNPQIFKKLVREAVERSEGLLNDKAVSLADRIIDGESSFNNIVWRIISFGAWLEKFSVRI